MATCSACLATLRPPVTTLRVRAMVGHVSGTVVVLLLVATLGTAEPSHLLAYHRTRRSTLSRYYPLVYGPKKGALASISQGRVRNGCKCPGPRCSELFARVGRECALRRACQADLFTSRTTHSAWNKQSNSASDNTMWRVPMLLKARPAATLG